MTYTNSPLVSYTKLSPNHSGQRNHIIDTITIHCVVGQCSVEVLGSIFAPASREASSNYGVGYDGKIGMYVEEKNRSWCTSSASNDHRAITIEVASDTTEPYAVTDAAYNALIKLVADICKRNNIKKLIYSTNKADRVNHKNGCNMTVHRDYANKSCPGTYLYERQDKIAKAVNAILGADKAETSKPTTSGTLYRVQAGAYKNKANAEAQLKKVKAKGFDACIVEADGYYKIQVGAYSVRANADAQLKKVKAAGFTAIITTVANKTATTQQAQTTDTAKTIWDFLTGKGLNAFAVAGIMGNLNAESALNPKNLQQTYEKKLGYTDASYTEAVDKGTYGNFVKDSAGYGLAQWTYWSRKQALLEYAQSVKKSIGDLGMQLEFLWKELQGYKTVMSVLKSATSVKQASDIILTGYEKPANQGDSVKATRAKYGQAYYDKYAGKTSTAPAEKVETFKAYTVKVTASALNIRKGPGTNYGTNGVIRDKGVYTIVAESTGKGATKWGKLKSGAGWISLDYTKKL